MANPRRNGPNLAEKNPVFVCRAAPAPGLRAYEYGTLWYVGGSGYSWSATVSGSNVRFLDFYCNGVSPQYGDGRAYGLPLRCLQE